MADEKMEQADIEVKEEDMGDESRESFQDDDRDGSDHEEEMDDGGDEDGGNDDKDDDEVPTVPATEVERLVSEAIANKLGSMQKQMKQMAAAMASMSEKPDRHKDRRERKKASRALRRAEREKVDYWVPLLNAVRSILDIKDEVKEEKKEKVGDKPEEGGKDGEEGSKEGEEGGKDGEVGGKEGEAVDKDGKGDETEDMAKTEKKEEDLEEGSDAKEEKETPKEDEKMEGVSEAAKEGEKATESKEDEENDEEEEKKGEEGEEDPVPILPTHQKLVEIWKRFEEDFNCDRTLRTKPHVHHDYRWEEELYAKYGSAPTIDDEFFDESERDRKGLQRNKSILGPGTFKFEYFLYEMDRHTRSLSKVSSHALLFLEALTKGLKNEKDVSDQTIDMLLLGMRRSLVDIMDTSVRASIESAVERRRYWVDCMSTSDAKAKRHLMDLPVQGNKLFSGRCTESLRHPKSMFPKYKRMDINSPAFKRRGARDDAGPRDPKRRRSDGGRNDDRRRDDRRGGPGRMGGSGRSGGGGGRGGGGQGPRRDGGGGRPMGGQGRRDRRRSQSDRPGDKWRGDRNKAFGPRREDYEGYGGYDDGYGMQSALTQPGSLLNSFPGGSYDDHTNYAFDY